MSNACVSYNRKYTNQNMSNFVQVFHTREFPFLASNPSSFCKRSQLFTALAMILSETVVSDAPASSADFKSLHESIDFAFSVA
jgi:hypothetical protein